jgi:hypothetical protein
MLKNWTPDPARRQESIPNHRCRTVAQRHQAVMPSTAGARHRSAHRPVRPRHHPKGPQRRRPLGPARQKPGAARHPTQAPPPGAANLDRRAAATLPRHRPRGAAVRGLAPGGTDRHAPRRGPRATLGRRRPGWRLIALDPETVTALRAHHTRQAAERLALGLAWSAGELVFTREDGQPLHPDWFRRRFERASTGPGCPRSASTTCATPTPPWPSKQACTPRSSANDSVTPPWR